MPVGVECDLNRRVAQPQLNDFRVLTLGDEHRRMGVAEVVKPEGLANCGAYRRKPSPRPEIGAPQRTALGRREHEPVIARRPLGEVPGQLISEEPGERHLTTCSRRFGRCQCHLPTNVSKRLRDCQAPSEEITTAHPQTGEFAKPATGVGRGRR